MPNKPIRDKRSGRSDGVTKRRKRPTSPLSAAAILASSDALLPQLTQQLALQQSWRVWLEKRLPAPLTEKLAGVVEQEGRLTLLAASASWAARLRYAVKEIEAEIRAHAPGIGVIRVRVSRPP